MRRVFLAIVLVLGLAQAAPAQESKRTGVVQLVDLAIQSAANGDLNAIWPHVDMEGFNETMGALKHYPPSVLRDLRITEVTNYVGHRWVVNVTDRYGRLKIKFIVSSRTMKISAAWTADELEAQSHRR